MSVKTEKIKTTSGFSSTSKLILSINIHKRGICTFGKASSPLEFFAIQHPFHTLFDMHTKSCIIHFKCLVVMWFGNDTLSPLRSRVLTTSRLYNVVENDLSYQSQPITFNKTGIEYSIEWKDKYDQFQTHFVQQQIVQSPPK